MLKSCVLVWYHSSPESGFGESMSVTTVYGTTLRSAPCSAHSGIGFVRSFPITPSNVLPSSGPYRRPSTLSSRSVLEQHHNDMIHRMTSINSHRDALSTVPIPIDIKPEGSTGGDLTHLTLEPHHPIRMRNLTSCDANSH